MKEASWRLCLFALYFTLTHVFLRKESKKYLRNISFRINGFLWLEKLLPLSMFNVMYKRNFFRSWCKSLEKYHHRNTKLPVCWKSSIFREAPSNVYKTSAPNKQVLRYIPLQLKFLLLFVFRKFTIDSISFLFLFLFFLFFWGLISHIASCLLYLSA